MAAPQLFTSGMGKESGTLAQSGCFGFGMLIHAASSHRVFLWKNGPRIFGLPTTRGGIWSRSAK